MKIPSELTEVEAIAFNAIQSAAENDLPCPTNLDLEMLTGFSSSSMGPALIARLVRKQHIVVVERCQRFRRIKICATGKITARSPQQHTRRKHVPRGASSMAGKLAKKARRL